jgi:hypothetical protein
MHFYDAELLRLRARTCAESADGETDLRAALALARRQGATLFELRGALDLFSLRGEPARADLAAALGSMPPESQMPEVAQARAALARGRGGGEMSKKP